MLYCTCKIIFLNISCDTLKVALVVLSTFMVGKSSAGNVCKLKRDLPDLTVKRCSSQSNWTVAFSGSARKISWNFLALVVKRKSSLSLSAPCVWIWISKSVAKIWILPFTFSSKTLDKIGKVCLRSTMPVTACNGLSKSSREVWRMSMMFPCQK